MPVGGQTDMNLDMQVDIQTFIQTDRYAGRQTESSQTENEAAGEVNLTQCGPDTKARSLLLSDHLPAAHTHTPPHTLTHTRDSVFNRLYTYT